MAHTLLPHEGRHVRKPGRDMEPHPYAMGCCPGCHHTEGNSSVLCDLPRSDHTAHTDCQSDQLWAFLEPPCQEPGKWHYGNALGTGESVRLCHRHSLKLGREIGVC